VVLNICMYVCATLPHLTMPRTCEIVRRSLLSMNSISSVKTSTVPSFCRVLFLISYRKRDIAFESRSRVQTVGSGRRCVYAKSDDTSVIFPLDINNQKKHENHLDSSLRGKRGGGQPSIKLDLAHRDVSQITTYIQ
jgi:hypothetical protein